jgi:hypothetical protein
VATIAALPAARRGCLPAALLVPDTLAALQQWLRAACGAAGVARDSA